MLGEPQTRILGTLVKEPPQHLSHVLEPLVEEPLQHLSHILESQVEEPLQHLSQGIIMEEPSEGTLFKYSHNKR